MRRRAFLAALGTGAVASIGHRTSVGRRPASPTIAVESDPIPADRPFAADVRVVAQYDEAHPPRLAVELHNDTDEPQTASFGTAPPFSASTAVADDAVYALLPVGDTGVLSSPVSDPGVTSLDQRARPDAPVGGCWRTGSVARMGTPTQRRLAPGDSLAREYVLVQSAWRGTCFPAGSVRFVAESYQPAGTDWGLTVSVSYP